MTVCDVPHDISQFDQTPRSSGSGQFALDPELGRHVLAVSPDCIKVISLEGALLAVNEAAMSLLEIDDLATVIGTSWASGWPEAARPLIEAALASVRDGKSSRFVGYCPTLKGTPRWWDVVVSPIRGDAGEAVNALAISRDITAHREMEDRLRISEQRFRALADNIAPLAWMAHGDGDIFWYNRRWFDYTGTTLATMAGWGWQSVHHPNHVDRVVQKIADHFRSGEAWEDTFPLRAADGTYRWFLSRARPIRGDDGAIALWCGTNTDITDQRAAADRLRQKARIIEQSHEAIMVWHLDGAIQTWNKGCEELYGWSSAEAVGKSSHELLKANLGIPLTEFVDLLRNTKVWTGELRHLAKDNSVVWVDSRLQVIEIGGHDVVLETNRDITERRKADEIKRLLLSELDHRVKNTLAIVQSIASQTARRAGSLAGFTDSFNARLQSLASAHNLLTASHWSGMALKELIRSQLSLHSDGDDQIVVEGPDVLLPPQVALRLSLIIFELGSNARKYGALSQRQGRITISITLDADTPPRLRLVWKESGLAVRAESRERGFGTLLIERLGDPSVLQAELSFPPSGVECHISAVLQSVSQDPAMLFDPARSILPSRAMQKI